jgi:hypothetical protein
MGKPGPVHKPFLTPHTVAKPHQPGSHTPSPAHTSPLAKNKPQSNGNKPSATPHLPRPGTARPGQMAAGSQRPKAPGAAVVKTPVTVGGVPWSPVPAVSFNSAALPVVPPVGTPLPAPGLASGTMQSPGSMFPGSPGLVMTDSGLTEMDFSPGGFDAGSLLADNSDVGGDVADMDYPNVAQDASDFIPAAPAQTGYSYAPRPRRRYELPSDPGPSSDPGESSAPISYSSNPVVASNAPEPAATASPRTVDPSVSPASGAVAVTDSTREPAKVDDAASSATENANEPSPADALKIVTRAAVLAHPLDPSGTVAEVAEAFDITDLKGKTTNAQLTFLRQNWKEISPDEAQALANDGRLVIAGRSGEIVLDSEGDPMRDKDGRRIRNSGLVAIVVPGRLADHRYPIVAGSDRVWVKDASSGKVQAEAGPATSTEGQRADVAFKRADLSRLKYFTPIIETPPPSDERTARK